MTKTEQAILDRVREINNRDALAGLGTAPGDRDFTNRKNRFVKRLYESKAIVWVCSRSLGMGWAVPELASKFQP